MSDYVHSGSRSRPLESSTLELRLMFALFYLICLARAAALRLMPWRRRASFGALHLRESIFTEARHGAGTIVTSSFMGL